MANIGREIKRIEVEPTPVPEESPYQEPNITPASVPATAPDPELVPA